MVCLFKIDTSSFFVPKFTFTDGYAVKSSDGSADSWCLVFETKTAVLWYIHTNYCGKDTSKFRI